MNVTTALATYLVVLPLAVSQSGREVLLFRGHCLNVVARRSELPDKER
jgi:hypothetical protein